MIGIGLTFQYKFGRGGGGGGVAGFHAPLTATLELLCGITEHSYGEMVSPYPPSRHSRARVHGENPRISVER